jgi:hypothetical protein
MVHTRGMRNPRGLVTLAFAAPFAALLGLPNAGPAATHDGENLVRFTPEGCHLRAECTIFRTVSRFGWVEGSCFTHEGDISNKKASQTKRTLLENLVPRPTCCGL